MSDYTPPTLVTPTPGGKPGDGSLNGALTVQANVNSGTAEVLVRAGSDGRPLIQYQDTSHTVQFNDVGNTGFDASGNLNLGGVIHIFQDKFTSGLGVPPIWDYDARTGLTAADSAAKTLYTTTAAGQLYRLMGRILATAGTSPSATYTIKWTEGGATITKTLTISALDSDSDLSVLIQPDNATAITAQLTAISGTGTTVNVAATVEQMA